MKKTELTIAEIQKLHQAGNLDAAKEAYLFLLKKNPRYVEALHGLAILCAQQENFDEALEHIETAIDIQPTNSILYLHLANILKKQGLYSQAENVLQEIIQLDPSCISAYNNLGSVYYTQGKITDAIHAYQQALAIQPDYTEAHYNLGLALIKNQEFDTAIKHYETLLTHVPEHFAARFHLACTLMRQEKFCQAEQHFLVIDSTHPYHFETQTNLATCFLKQGAVLMAKTHYLRALELAPQDTQVLFNLGVINTQLDNIDQAIQHYQRVVQIDPDHFAAHNNLGTAFIFKQHPGLALQHFKQALRLQPDNNAIQYTIDALSKNQLLLAAPSDYVSTLFDAYADHYDEHLLKALDYQVPTLLHKAITSVTSLPDKQWQILDLGCGTGLCGTLFKTHAKKLVGVDLSSKMLDYAKQKNIYHELVLENIATFLTHHHETYDLITAGDVLVYFGDLDNIFARIHLLLNPHGFFVFNTEISATEDFIMTQSGRFAHKKQYIEALAAKHQLKICSYQTAVTRLQNNEPVHGHLYTLQRV